MGASHKQTSKVVGALVGALVVAPVLDLENYGSFAPKVPTLKRPLIAYEVEFRNLIDRSRL